MSASREGHAATATIVTGIVALLITSGGGFRLSLEWFAGGAILGLIAQEILGGLK
jgi:hypothetical protein